MSATNSDTIKGLTINQIMAYLPHRYPFLLLDRIIQVEPGQSLIALKNVSINEPFFQGHFPQRPIFPGVLIIEALAQATGVLVFASADTQAPAEEEQIFYLVGVDKARFKQPVEPGDQLMLEVTLQRIRRDVGSFKGEAKVDGKVVASAELLCAKRGIDI